MRSISKQLLTNIIMSKKNLSFVLAALLALTGTIGAYAQPSTGNGKPKYVSFPLKYKRPTDSRNPRVPPRDLEALYDAESGTLSISLPYCETEATVTVTGDTGYYQEGQLTQDSPTMDCQLQSGNYTVVCSCISENVYIGYLEIQ